MRFHVKTRNAAAAAICGLLVSASPMPAIGEDVPASPPPGPPAPIDEPASTEHRPTVIPVAITSQGGISLGAYEAGLEWSIMELLRARASRESFSARDPEKEATAYPEVRIRLVASTGASAGNANTFLGLLNYCRADSAAAQMEGAGMPLGASYSRNWFWRTWVPMGIDQLFPLDANAASYCLDLEEADDIAACLEDLQARSGGEVYRDDDALLSRNAYNRMERLLERMIAPAGSKPLYVMDRSCLYPLGVPLTLTTSNPIDWESDSAPDAGTAETTSVRRERRDQLSVPVGRALAVIAPTCEPDGEGDGCAIRFQNYDWNRLAPKSRESALRRLGWLLDLPEERLAARRFQRIPARTVDVLIEAGSAVPVAFGSKELDYCAATGERPVESGRVCGDGVSSPQNVTRRSWYDGGTFDNLPIGLAYELALSERSLKPDSTSDMPVHVIALDVSRARYQPEHEGQPEPPKEDLLGVLGTLSSVIPIARKYELQSLSRYFPHARESDTAPLPAEKGTAVYPTSRYFPVVGESLGAFGAFLGRPFREYDFHMGVYDGIHYLAKAMCAGFGPRPEDAPAEDAWIRRSGLWKSGAGEEALRECVVKVFKDSYEILGLVPADAVVEESLVTGAAGADDFNRFMGSVAVLTATKTEIEVTNRFVVKGIALDDLIPLGSGATPGPLPKSAGSGARRPDGALLDRLLEVPSEALSPSRKNAKGEKAQIEESRCSPGSGKAREAAADETGARYAIFENVLQSGQCIATVGAAEHPDSDEFWLAKFLGPEFLYFAANLRKVNEDLIFLRKRYLDWKLSCLRVRGGRSSDKDAASCHGPAPAYVEDGLAMSVQPPPPHQFLKKDSWRRQADWRESLVEDPENWSMVFAHRLLDRLAAQNDEHGFSEVLVDMVQFALRFEERQRAPGFQFGPSLTPWLFSKEMRPGVVVLRLFLPSYLGSGLEWYPQRDHAASMSFSLEMWRTQLASGNGVFAWYPFIAQMNLQATEYQRFTVGPEMGWGIRTGNVVVSEVEAFGGISGAFPYGEDPFGYSAPYWMMQFGGSLYWLGGFVRMSAGVRFHSDDDPAFRNLTPFFSVGLCDLPGLAYWLAKISS